MDDGATDGWHKVLELLCNPGDPILVEAWTYPSAIESGWPMGVRPVPVPIDADGLIPEGLDKLLGEWNEEKRGCKRPRVLYTVPGTQHASFLSISRTDLVHRLSTFIARRVQLDRTLADR